MPQPTKEEIRKWQQDRVKARKPPPDPKQIKRELGWSLLDAERKQRSRTYWPCRPVGNAGIPF